ncbi:MAG: hypothetical protein PHR00_00730 [Patescibacteria group bacterium]|nr:hypothetical protein [Patescibacteria group bacterium]
MFIKILIIAPIVLVIATGLFLFGNNMRCVYAEGKNCPGLCKKINISCEGKMFTERCEAGNTVCQSPEISEYQQMIKDWLASFKK